LFGAKLALEIEKHKLLVLYSLEIEKHKLRVVKSIINTKAAFLGGFADKVYFIYALLIT